MNFILNIIDKKLPFGIISVMIKIIIRFFVSKKSIQKIIEIPPDLSEFHERPTPRLITGLLLMGFSYLIGWPAVATLVFMASRLNEPLIAVIGCPAIYGFSHVIFFAGALLARAPHYMGVLSKYALGILFRKLIQYTS